MRIAVIAANGRLGKAFVEKALHAGHHVTAGVRGVNNLDEHPNLRVISCDATNVNELKALLKNQQVVVSALGHIKGSPAYVQTMATEATVSVMNELGIARYVDVTGTGVRLAGDKIPIIDRILNFAIKIIDRNRVNDGIAHQAVLQKSNLAWTTIRVLKLENIAPRKYALTLHGPTKWFVGRSEVAKAMLEVIEQNSFIKQAPIISGHAKKEDT